MRKILITCAIGLLATSPALASDKTDVMSVVHKWGSTHDSFCTDEEYVIDAIAPYEWHGSSTCPTWRNDNDAWWKQSD
jgi:hypothetical protein